MQDNKQRKKDKCSLTGSLHSGCGRKLCAAVCLEFHFVLVLLLSKAWAAYRVSIQQTREMHGLLMYRQTKSYFEPHVTRSSGSIQEHNTRSLS
jgi:hypothetical protein